MLSKCTKYLHTCQPKLPYSHFFTAQWNCWIFHYLRHRQRVGAAAAEIAASREKKKHARQKQQKMWYQKKLKPKPKTKTHNKSREIVNEKVNKNLKRFGQDRAPISHIQRARERWLSIYPYTVYSMKYVCVCVCSTSFAVVVSLSSSLLTLTKIADRGQTAWAQVKYLAIANDQSNLP